MEPDSPVGEYYRHPLYRHAPRIEWLKSNDWVNKEQKPMHILTINAIEQDIHHVIAAVAHWLNKIKQEVLHVDGGPAEDGVYEFDHAGKPTTVTWSASAVTVAPLKVADTDPDVDAKALADANADLEAAGEPHPSLVPGLPVPGPEDIEAELVDGVISPEAAAAGEAELLPGDGTVGDNPEPTLETPAA